MLPLHVCSDGPQVPVYVVYQSQLAAGVQLLQHQDKTRLRTANNNVPFSDSHPSSSFYLTDYYTVKHNVNLI